MKKILFFLLTICLLSSCGRRHSKDTFSYSEKDLFNRYLLSKHYAAKLKKTYEEASDQFFADVDKELVVIEVLFRRIKREVQEIEEFKEDFSSVAFQLIEKQYSLEKRIAAIEKKLGIEDTAEEDAAASNEDVENDAATSTAAPDAAEAAKADDSGAATETVESDEATKPIVPDDISAAEPTLTIEVPPAEPPQEDTPSQEPATAELG